LVHLGAHLCWRERVLVYIILMEELENGDTELFAPVYPQGGGPAGDQGPATEDQPGRPSRDDTTKVGPDRDREDKDTGQPQGGGDQE